METGIGISADSAPYLPLDREPNVTDDARLNQLGYKQELSRSLSELFGDILHYISDHWTHNDVQYRTDVRWTCYNGIRVANCGRLNHDSGSGNGRDLLSLSYFWWPILFGVPGCATMSGVLWFPGSLAVKIFTKRLKELRWSKIKIPNKLHKLKLEEKQNSRIYFTMNSAWESSLDLPLRTQELQRVIGYPVRKKGTEKKILFLFLLSIVKSAVQVSQKMGLPSHTVENGSVLVDSGQSRLRELGYKQELKRDLSVFSNFAFSFSIISVLTGITTLYNTGLTFGGPISLVYGWFIAGGFTMFVGLSMAEICSSYPTSGGLYYWSARLAGRNWAPFASWLTGWFNIVGQWAVTTSVDFSLAQLIQVIILLSTGGKNGGGYEASKYVVIAFHGAILSMHAIINSLPISVLSFFGQLAAVWNLLGMKISGLNMNSGLSNPPFLTYSSLHLGVVLLMILIPSVATERASAKFVFTHFNTDNGEGINSKAYIFVLGLLMSQYTLTGYDASAHMTEETKNADKNGPKGIISAIGISIIFGWGYLLGITFAVTDIPYLLSEDNDAGGYAIAEIFYLAFKNRYGSGVGGIICLGVIAIAIFFCGMSSVTSNSRMVYAFSRDGAMPLSSLWHKVNKQEVPINAVWLSAFISFCMALTSLGSLVAFQAMVSIATIGLYIAYALPIFFRVSLARKSFVPGPFNLGRYGVVVGWIAVLWVATISVLFSLPVAYPVTSETLNYTPVAVGGLLVITVSWWIVSARHWFTGPITNI
ncbi:hypothetical protein CXB51_002653 [Gossypium anomalum]|uniref:Amino-acid permease BAT1 homolog n=1 Tax=Gossypium anomalum TaxID=47600 RepID=A0A8J5ZES8_9ROSI|nr:hypothetical protein CXB51_002653 [Gossypium anomalum]